MIARLDEWLPRKHAPTIRLLAREIDTVVSGFVRGQGTVLLLLSVFYAVGLSLIGLNFALLIAMVSGLISFVPYVGAIFGLAVGGTVAVLQFLARLGTDRGGLLGFSRWPDHRGQRSLADHRRRSS